MTKSKHWVALGIIYIACFIIAFVCFMTVPILGPFVVLVPGVLTVGGIVQYLRSSRK